MKAAGAWRRTPRGTAMQRVITVACAATGLLAARSDLPGMALPASGTAAAAAVPQPRQPPQAQGVRLETFRINNLNMRVASAGPEDGPLVLLIHGWPDLWYGWRYQLPALAKAGYRVVAPDMRGYGGTDAPADVAEYILPRIEEDMLGLLSAFGRESCFLVGHDFGANIVYRAGIRHPKAFPLLVAMSVPYMGHSPAISLLKQRFGNPVDQNSSFNYILFHTLPEATAAYDADIRETLRFCHASVPGCEVEGPPKVTDGKLWIDGRPVGMLERIGRPSALPPWLSEQDLDYYASEYRRHGFNGSLNWYRAADMSYYATKDLEGRKIQQPVLVILGESDLMLQMYGGAQNVTHRMKELCSGALEVEILPGVGHWPTQQAAELVNARLLTFLKEAGGV